MMLSSNWVLLELQGRQIALRVLPTRRGPQIGSIFDIFQASSVVTATHFLTLKRLSFCPTYTLADGHQSSRLFIVQYRSDSA